MNKIVSFADTIFNKILPKKFIVFVVATIFCWWGKVDGDVWAYISLAYLGVNGVQKFSPFMGVKK